MGYDWEPQTLEEGQPDAKAFSRDTLWPSLVAHMVKKSTLNVGDPGQALGQEVPLEIGKGNGYPLQYSCLENPMDRRTWQVTVHRVAKSRTRLSTYTPSLPSFPHRVTLRFPNHH